ncbi:MAG: hypothetical protein PHC34_02635 [Candidatus Gastranaerophilales bacterium]|nr:hypothetical protein [Candidatus Gastranaerophilales bacterium]
MKKNGEYVDYPWRVNQIILKEQGYTDRVCSCNAGGIQNSKKLLLFHLLPDRFELDNIEKAFNAKIPELKLQNVNLRGLIAGGDSFSGSSILFEKLKDIFDRFKIDSSIIWGQQVRGSRIFYSVKNDTWVINGPKSTVPFSEDIQTLEDLKSNLKYINISDKDELYMGKTRIKNADANQGL